MGQLTAKDTAALSGLAGIVALVEKLLAGGVSAAELAEKVASFVDPAMVPALTALIGILQEAETLISKV